MFCFRKEPLKVLVGLSTPAGMQTFMNEGSRLLSSFWIAQLGTIPFAANSLAVAAESLSFMPGSGFAVAAASLVGQSLGAGDHEMAEKVAKRSVFYAALLMGIVGMAFFFFPYAIMSLFSTDKASVLEASKAIRIGAFEQVPIAIGMVMSGALKGAGDTNGPFRISLVTNILFRLPLIFAIVFLIKGSISHVWAATAVQYGVEATLMVIRYRRGHWRRIDIR
jgi:Na+-driven multidrug efflux pump